MWAVWLLKRHNRTLAAHKYHFHAKNQAVKDIGSIVLRIIYHFVLLELVSDSKWLIRVDLGNSRRRMFATNRFVTSACSRQSVTSRLRSITSWHMFVTVNVSLNAYACRLVHFVANFIQSRTYVPKSSRHEVTFHLKYPIGLSNPEKPLTTVFYYQKCHDLHDREPQK